MKTLYMIGGTMGVGKTTACRILKQKLQNSVFLDGDWCWDANPFQVSEETKAMVLDNICYLLNNFIACSAYKNIIFCWVMHEQAIIDDILSRLNIANCDIKCISLISDAKSLKQRIESDTKRTDRNAEKSLARLPLYQTLNTLKLDVSQLSAEETAEKMATL